ncbi:MAG: flagellar assembly protein FliW [Mariprofundaceae bacterium]|nr:flagellar assembly protein FliW [Mariprofundaceae bacterium]
MKKNEAAEQNEFVFPQGLAGFGDAHRFGFIYEGKGDMICMQSLDAPEAAFILTPWDEQRLGVTPTLNAEQMDCLHLTNAVDQNDSIMWMLVLNPFADQAWITANMRAPIALHAKEGRGIQCIRHDTSLELRYRWMPQSPAA